VADTARVATLRRVPTPPKWLHAETCSTSTDRRVACHAADRTEVQPAGDTHTEARAPPHGTFTARRGLPPPARSPLIAFLRFWRAALWSRRSSHATEAARASRLSVPLSRPGLFHPGNALELSPSGLCSARRSRPLSRPLPPMPLDDRTQATAAGFEGLIPPSRPPNPSRS